MTGDVLTSVTEKIYWVAGEGVLGGFATLFVFSRNLRPHCQSNYRTAVQLAHYNQFADITRNTARAVSG